MTKTRNNDFSSRTLQHVFRVGAHGAKLGLPEGACFLMAPGKDYKLANDFLYGVHAGKFAEFCLVDRPEWMNRRGVLRPRSLKATAQATATGIDTLDARNITVLELDNPELLLLRRDLEARKIESGIGFIQTTMMNFAQWCCWAKLRGPLNVSHERIVVRMGPHDQARPREVTKVHAVAGQLEAATSYMAERDIKLIVEEVMTECDDGHGPALMALVDTGMRGSEPGSILNRHMPRARDVDPAYPAKFPLWGKGGKKRYPEIPVPTLEVIDQYRAGDRRLAVARALEKGGKEPDALFLKRNGTPVTYASLRRVFKKACKKLGIAGRLHWLRHSFAANYLAKPAVDLWMARRRAGVTVSMGELNTLTNARQYSLMRVLGHKSLTTTAIYLEHVHRVLLAKFAASTETMH
ncbi:tyrosine-type recombinase/integrase [Bradyrhizobium elkanii]|uniref:tyrosine-type recombinase/integrase n=1 Tax=Bradyrhizobium elkanii TaxID=29448 RepID=UPI001FCA501A|nr:tyrosine-type recombinase/integrase [Bradyrhizobium elkanii]WLA87339.1 tyrosine-type recombinase/integrase [Bradyrhizobium elkanii]